MRTTIRVPATTANLGPGFDCLGLALDLWNEFEFEPVPEGGGQSVEVGGFGAERLPGDGSNLILRAFNTVYRALALETPGVLVRSANGFPIGSGLGSSASAIVAGVLAAIRFAGEKAGTLDALRIAAGLEGHPDNVSAALLGGLTVSIREGEETVSVRAPIATGWIAGVVVPRIEKTTAEMRAALPERVLFKDAVFNLGRVALVIRAFEAGNEDLLRTAMDDRLHQPVRLTRIPGAGSALESVRGSGAACALSGAGPGLIAFSMQPERVRSAIRQMEAVFADLDIGTWSGQGGISERGAEEIARPLSAGLL
jgi:homoserine kinase